MAQSSRFEPLPPDRGENAGRAVKESAGASVVKADGSIDLLQLIGQAEDISRDDYSRRLQRMVTDSQRAWRNEHSQGSKYLDKNAFRGRSRLFVPKTRAGIRKNKAGAAAALFANDEVISITAEYDDDPAQLASARVLQKIMNYRLQRTNPKSGMPWFQIAVAGRMAADVEGCTISKQFWEYAEIPTGKTKRELVPTEDGQGGMFYEEQEVPEMKVSRDRPMVELLPLENCYLDPAAPWYDPVQLGAWFIARYPMHLHDVRAMIKGKGKQGNGPKWLKVSDEVLRKGFMDDQRSTARRARERSDRFEHISMPREWDIIWVNENFVRYDDEELTFWSIGRHGLLSKPMPTEEVYPEQYGMRPYTFGVSEIEPHITSPMPPAYSWQPLQLELNDVVNLRLDSVKRSIAPIAKVKRGKNVDFEQIKRRGQPEAMLLLDDPETDVVFEPTPPPPGTSYTETAQINNAFDELSGQFSSSSVQSNRQLNETVGGMKMIAGATDSISEFDLRTWLETWAEPTLRQVVNLIQHYESDEKIVALAGRKAEAWYRYGVNPTLDMLLECEVTLKINAGIGAQNPQQMLQKLAGALQMMEPMFPIMQAQGIMPNMEEIITEVFGRAGYSDGRRFFNFGEPPPPGAGDPKAEAEMAKVEVMREQGQQKLQMQQAEGQAKLQLQREKQQGDLMVKREGKMIDAQVQMETAVMQAEQQAQMAAQQGAVDQSNSDRQWVTDTMFRDREQMNAHEAAMAKVRAGENVGLAGASAKGAQAGKGKPVGRPKPASLPSPVTPDAGQGAVMKALLDHIQQMQQPQDNGSERVMMAVAQILAKLDEALEKMGGPKRVVRDPQTNEIIGVVPVETAAQVARRVV